MVIVLTVYAECRTVNVVCILACTFYVDRKDPASRLHVLIHSLVHAIRIP